jgi:hypothetical protein
VRSMKPGLSAVPMSWSLLARNASNGSFSDISATIYLSLR